MRKLFRLKSKLKKDNGNATIVLGIMLLASLILVGGLLMDVSKAYQLKSSYIDVAKKATQAAVMKQDSQGFLTPEAAGEAIYRYEEIKRETVMKKDSYFSKCSGKSDKDVEYIIYFGRENSPAVEVDRITRDRVMNSTSQAITDNLFTQSEKANFYRNGYTTIKIELTESTENILLPVGFKFTQAKDSDSIKCQEMGISAQADIFVGDEGKRYD